MYNQIYSPCPNMGPHGPVQNWRRAQKGPGSLRPWPCARVPAPGSLGPPPLLGQGLALGPPWAHVGIFGRGL